MWFCCRCDVIVIYDVIDHTTTRRQISDIETDDLVVTVCRVILLYEARVTNIFVWQTQFCGLDCSTGFMVERVGLVLGLPHIESLRKTS